MVSEAEWETIALDRFDQHGWEPLHGNQIAPGTTGGRTSWDDLVLRGPLLEAMRRLNLAVPVEYLEQAMAEIVAPTSQDSIAENFRLHQIFTHGYRGLSYIDPDGIEQNPTIRLVSAAVHENSYAAVNQVIIRSTEIERRFDLVLYLNGLPVVIVELKKAGAEAAGLDSAHAQLGTYLREFPLAFRCCVLSIISDGITARYGTPWTPFNHYAPWNVDDDGVRLLPGAEVAETDLGVELEYLIDGLGNQERFGQLLQNFVAFDAGADGYVKRIAKPHQYFAVTRAVGSTVDAVESNGKAGVVWHTQGSGKSMEMELYAHLVARQPKLKNPTLIVVTDRTELDSQLFETFHRSTLLGETPLNVSTRDELRRELTNRTTGGIYFTTLQKFGLTDDERRSGRDHPLLTDRRNIIVIVDEAHRSHYDNLDGFARHIRDALPYAAFIAFTGTPISFADRNTQDVFGTVIDTYDLTRAVQDGATVPVYFEARLISVDLAGDVSEEQLDEAADEATLGLDDVERERIEKSVAVINAVYGAPARLTALAADIVAHWETRAEAMLPFVSELGEPPASGKAFIVGATREICAALYEEIVRLRPDWHDDAIDKGAIKVVYSGSAADPQPVAKHVRRQGQTKVIQERIKNADDPLQLVIVKDMMLTGFDAPPLHTLYLDRPLQGALLMQTLARVNRTFRGKTDGLLVAYAPLLENLNKALAEYTEADQADRPVGRSIDEAVVLTRTLVQAIDELCVGYDWRARLGNGDPRSWIKAAVGLTNHLRSPDNSGQSGRRRRRRPRTRPAVPQARRTTRPGLGAGRRRGDPGGPPGHHAVLRRGPGLDGQVRRAGTAGVRAADPRGHPTDAGRPRCICRSHRRHHRHLRGRRIAEADPLRPGAGLHRQSPGGRQPSPRDRGPPRPAHPGVVCRHAVQPGPSTGVLGADPRADEPLHQLPAHLRGGDRRADRARQGGGRRVEPRPALHAAAVQRRACVL